jgi:hypothetical protein
MRPSSIFPSNIFQNTIEIAHSEIKRRTSHTPKEWREELITHQKSKRYTKRVIVNKKENYGKCWNQIAASTTV